MTALYVDHPNEKQLRHKIVAVQRTVIKLTSVVRERRSSLATIGPFRQLGRPGTVITWQFVHSNRAGTMRQTKFARQRTRHVRSCELNPDPRTPIHSAFAAWCSTERRCAMANRPSIRMSYLHVARIADRTASQ